MVPRRAGRSASSPPTPSLTGAKHCLATANGTSALLTSLGALGVGPGDEVIVPPYTFVATVNAVLLLHALPVFVDTDLETFQIDARKIEAAITDRTRVDRARCTSAASAADLDTILPLASARGIPVVEDACQAHLAEWRGRKVGTLGKAGCFSFQASKNLNSGEGGAILTNDADLLEACYAFHNNSRGAARRGDRLLVPRHRREPAADRVPGRAAAGADDAARGAVADARAERRLPHERCSKRSPASPPRGCTRAARATRITSTCSATTRRRFCRPAAGAFLKALRREGIPGSSGYSPLNKEPFLDDDVRDAAASSGSTARAALARLARAQPLPAERPPLRGGGVADADDAARPAGRHGPDRRGGAQGPDATPRSSRRREAVFGALCPHNRSARPLRTEWAGRAPRVHQAQRVQLSHKRLDIRRNTAAAFDGGPDRQRRSLDDVRRQP